MRNKDAIEIMFIRHAETDYNDWKGRDPSDGELMAKSNAIYWVRSLRM